MPARVTAMIRVPDVGATVAYYEALGFTVVDSHRDDGELNWALLSLGDGRVMFNAGGRASSEERREVDLYVHTDAVDQLHETVKSSVDVREPPHDTFYGMREFIVRDLNGFWITFGAPREK